MEHAQICPHPSPRLNEEELHSLFVAMGGTVDVRAACLTVGECQCEDMCIHHAEQLAGAPETMCQGDGSRNILAV